MSSNMSPQARLIQPMPTKPELILELVEGLERDLSEALDLLSSINFLDPVYDEVQALLTKHGRIKL